MRSSQGRTQRITKIVLLLLTIGASIYAFAGLFGFGGTSWKEEVLLHDGSKIVVERSVDRGGRHEVGQQSPIKEQSLSFDLPPTNERVIWKSKFSEDVGLADFQPLLLDIYRGIAYVVTFPVGCLAYNKWGRPNPPYVIFKYQNRSWQRVTIQELPAELNKPNLIISSPDNEVEKMGKRFVTIAMVKQANRDLNQTQFKIILRDKVKGGAGGDCAEMIHVNDGWEGLGFFRHQPSYASCLKYCVRKGVNQQNCPCNRLFMGKK